MSGRKLSRFALVGWLSAALAAPAAAQDSTPGEPGGRVQVEVTFDVFNGVEFQWGVRNAPVAPMPHAAAAAPCCGPGCCQPAAAPAMPQPQAPVYPAGGSSCAPGPHGSLVVGAGGAACPAQPCPACPQSARPAPPDAMRRMAADAFGGLLLQSGVTAPCPPPAPHVITLHAVAPKPPLAGTWYRDLGANRCVITAAADHMTITVSQANEIGDRTVTSNITFTADYHLARDGVTAVGLITGVDAHFDGDLPEPDAASLIEAVAALRKGMEDRPFAMSCRLYGETLVVGNVRMPELRDPRDQPAAYVAGRYARAGEKPLPKQKAMKLPDPRALPAAIELPPPYYGGPGAIPVQGFMPPPLPGTVPTGDLLPPQSAPTITPRVRPYSEWQPTMPAPTMPAPTMPAPTMSEPTPPVMPPPAPLSLNAPAPSGTRPNAKPAPQVWFHFGLSELGGF